MSARMTAYEMASKMIKKPRPDAVARLEKAQADYRREQRIQEKAEDAQLIAQLIQGQTRSDNNGMNSSNDSNNGIASALQQLTNQLQQQNQSMQTMQNNMNAMAQAERQRIDTINYYMRCALRPHDRLA